MFLFSFCGYCLFVMGKAYVIFLKSIIILRFELVVVLVFVRVSDILNREFRYDEIKEVFWIDSKVV